MIPPKILITLISFLLLDLIPVYSQTLRINEVAPSNNTFLDEDNETKDWIELYNTTEAPISLENWSITDDQTDPQKWIFPNIEIAPKDFYILFASGKDRNVLLTYQTVIKEGDVCKYIIPTFSTSSDWRSINFDDSAWIEGKTGIGYGDQDDQTIVPNRTRSIFVRQNFTINDLSTVEQVIFQVDYDDAFVAYLNGVEIARANMNAGAFPPYNANVPTDREAELYRGGRPERFTLSNVAELLVPGENVLAVQVHNVNTNSSDLSIIPFLSLGEKGVVQESTPPAILNIPSSFLHTNFKISGTETVYLYNGEKKLQDSLYIPSLPSNITVGRFPDGTANSRLFEAITPNASNSPNNFLDILDQEILFSKASGIYPNGISVILSSETEGIIRFTTDGTNPTTNSNIFTNPIEVRKPTTVKAAIFKDNFLPSRITANTYLIDISHELPIISIAFDPKDFFDEASGMYSFGSDYAQDFPHFGANFWKDLEKPVHLTFFENGQTKFATGAGAKIFGGWSRGHAQRSLSIFFRKEYGDNVLKYPLFPQRNYDLYEALVLRNSGNDWQRTMLRDLTLTGLMDNSNVDIQAGRPTVTYLNDAYWGIYNIREKINEHYLSALHNVSSKNITILERNGDVIFGGNQEYLDLINFVSTNNLANQEHYRVVEDQIDMANYIQYQVAQIYMDNTDWPGNNIKFWKAKNGKWRWILFDTDFGFGIWAADNYKNNTLSFALNPAGPNWPNPPWSTLLFRRLIENDGFKKRFINTFADELNTRFLANKVQGRIVENRSLIESEMPRQMDKWGEGNLNSWRFNVDQMNVFAGQRPGYMRTHIRTQFNLPIHQQVVLEIDQPNAGSIQLNTIRITDARWTGFYFPTVPITFTAIAKPGYTFLHWTGEVGSNNRTITIDPKKTIRLQAHFIESEDVSAESEVVINEINYNSNDELKVGDWVEFYNNGSEQDLTDWVFKDDDDAHVFKFPVGTILGTADYLVLTSSAEKFAERFPNVTNTIGDFDFGLSSKGEFLRLFDSEGTLVDSVFYLPDNGWPEAANGGGPTLELLAPDKDNTVPENWITYTSNGTPGRANGVYTSTVDLHQLAAAVQIVPNPFKERIFVTINLPNPSIISIDLLSINGQIIQSLSEEEKVQKQKFEFLMPSLTPGIYLIRIRVNKKEVVKKVVRY